VRENPGAIDVHCAVSKAAPRSSLSVACLDPVAVQIEVSSEPSKAGELLNPDKMDSTSCGGREGQRDA
jgi:hypothetical protein